MRVLITSPKGKERLVKAFEEAGSYIVRTLSERPDLIVPTVDEELPFFAQARDWFKQQGIEVMVGSDMTIAFCRDKYQFFQFCRRHEFKTPDVYMGDFIAKPRFGKGSRGIVNINRSYVVQDLIKDQPEVSIDYFADLEGQFISAIARYRINVVNGESQAMEIVPPNFDYETVKRLGQELKLVGHNVIQGFWDGKQMTFTEVNPRFGGGSWLTFDIFNSPKWLTENVCLSMRKFGITSSDSSPATTSKQESIKQQ